MDRTRDMYDRLRPPDPTPDDEICDCPHGTPVKLMPTALCYNPIHCLECNGEVPPERLELDARLADDLAAWLSTYRAIDWLEFASGEYEMWAREQLLDLDSPPNRDGLELNGRLNDVVRSYFWLWQPQSEEDWLPPTRCPLCSGELSRHATGLFPQLLCEADSIVIVGGQPATHGDPERS